MVGRSLERKNEGVDSFSFEIFTFLVYGRHKLLVAHK